jgi:hypothetical protein
MKMAKTRNTIRPKRITRKNEYRVSGSAPSAKPGPSPNVIAEEFTSPMVNGV